MTWVGMILDGALTLRLPVAVSLRWVGDNRPGPSEGLVHPCTERKEVVEQWKEEIGWQEKMFFG